MKDESLLVVGCNNACVILLSIQ